MDVAPANATAALRPVGRRYRIASALLRRPHRCFTYTLRGSLSSYRGVCTTCTALYLHTHPVDRGCHTAAFNAVAAAITPRRFVLPIRRHGRAASFDHSAVTMMICPSEGYVIRRRVGTYCRSASRLWRAARAADVLRASDALLTYRDARASRRCRSPLI